MLALTCTGSRDGRDKEARVRCPLDIGSGFRGGWSPGCLRWRLQYMPRRFLRQWAFIGKLKLFWCGCHVMWCDRTSLLTPQSVSCSCRWRAASMSFIFNAFLSGTFLSYQFLMGYICTYVYAFICPFVFLLVLYPLFSWCYACNHKVCRPLANISAHK